MMCESNIKEFAEVYEHGEKFFLALWIGLNSHIVISADPSHTDARIGRPRCIEVLNKLERH